MMWFYHWIMRTHEVLMLESDRARAAHSSRCLWKKMRLCPAQPGSSMKVPHVYAVAAIKLQVWF